MSPKVIYGDDASSLPSDLMERISLSNSAFEGHNNVYLFRDGSETGLVDTGDGTNKTRKELRTALANYGVKFGDIDRVFLTHWHHDHIGLAGAIQAAGGATVHIHEADADLASGDASAWSKMRSHMESLFDEWGMPPKKQSGLRNLIQGPNRFDEFPDVSSFRNGEVFSMGSQELTAVHVPGHAAGLCLFEMEQSGQPEILSSDVLLPVYTPNVGGADIRVDRPLERYVCGLKAIVEGEYTRAWPGHRHPIDDPSKRAAEIIDHHEERAWRVLDTVRQLGPCDTWTVSDELFGTLEGIHVLHGPGESHAHLEHLERTGAVVCNESEYRLADGTAEPLESMADRRWPLDI